MVIDGMTNACTAILLYLFFFFFFGWPMFEVRSVRDRVSMRVTSYSVYRWFRVNSEEKKKKRTNIVDISNYIIHFYLLHRVIFIPSFEYKPLIAIFKVNG